jgi:hypothetical protein
LFLGVLNSHFFLYENNSLQIREQPLSNIDNNNQTDIERFLSSDTFSRQHTDDFVLMNTFADTETASGSPLPYVPFTSASIQQDTTLQHYYETSSSIQHDDILSFDVNVIHCSLENSSKHAGLHLYWVWIDLLVNVFLPFTGKTSTNIINRFLLNRTSFVFFFFFFFSFIVCLAAMIACTIIIILTLVRSSSRAGSTSARRSRRRRNISVMLITVNLVFISLTAPIVIFLSIYPYAKEGTNRYRQAVLILIKIFCIILMNLNHSVNIIIYSVTAKEFRSEMISFLRAVVYCLIGKPINPNDFAYLHDDGTCLSRFRRFRRALFSCCRWKFGSNSSNTTDTTSGLQHTTLPGINHRASSLANPLRKKFKKRKHAERNGKRKSSVVRYSETSTTHRMSHRLTVQIQTEPLSSSYEREDFLLHRLSNSTED